MSERYWISGVQIGLIQTLTDEKKLDLVRKIWDEIEGKQFIGNMAEPHDEYEIIIRRKVK